MRSRIRTVLFDLSGTLIDDFLIAWKSFCMVFKHYGRPIPSLEEFRREFKLPHEEYLTENGIEPERVKEAVELAKKRYLENFSRIKLFPEVKRVLRNLKTKNVVLGIVSQTPRRLLDANLERFGIANFFDRKNTLSSDDTKEQKPHPKPIQVAMKRMGVADGRQTIYVGDMVEDILMAKAAEIVPVAIYREGANYHSRERLEKSDPYRIIQDLRELIPILHL